METLHVYAQHCNRAGCPILQSDWDNNPESDDFLEVDLTLAEAERFDALKSNYGWQVAASIREQLGVCAEPASDEEE
jgi:hypothetical protein